jgi:hypothetical protein
MSAYAMSISSEVTAAEMVRVLLRDGYIFLIAPSSLHRGVVDCSRFYSDAYKALRPSPNGRLRVRRVGWRDMTTTLQGGQRQVWHDIVGVFRHHPRSR